MQREKATSSSGRPHDIIESYLVVLVAVCGVRTLPSTPNPSLNPRWIFFFLFLNGAYITVEKCPHEHIDKRHVIFWNVQLLLFFLLLAFTLSGRVET